MAQKLKELIELTVQKGGSDLHINTNIPPQIRVDGTLTSASSKALTSEETRDLCFEFLNKDQIDKLEKNRELDLAFEIENLTRIRANIFWSLGNISGAFRTIPFRIPTPEELKLPQSVVDLTEKPRGLVLLTGETGCGKSTTLASLLNSINFNKHLHIVTIEDPIEYVLQQKKSTINQREISLDSLSFKNALKYLFRQDPDVVLIGEMRDLETIQSAITIAETGHLVFATLHTNTAVQTIDRIIDVFPPFQQPQIRTQLSLILEGVVSQHLLPCIGGGRTLALEMMFPTPAIRNLIREAKTHLIQAELQVGQQNTQMITMDQSLASLAKSGTVDYEVCRSNAVNCDDFEAYLNK